jgi:hypothetical protein
MKDKRSAVNIPPDFPITNRRALAVERAIGEIESDLGQRFHPEARIIVTRVLDSLVEEARYLSQDSGGFW